MNVVGDPVPDPDSSSDAVNDAVGPHLAARVVIAALVVCLVFIVTATPMALVARRTLASLAGTPGAHTGRAPARVSGTHLDGYSTSLEAFPVRRGVAEWVRSSHFVAEVEVEAVGALRFNTPGGGLPTQDPAELVNPDAKLTDTEGLALFRSVVLGVGETHKTDGITTTGYVVASFGGAVPGSAGGYEYTSSPTLGELTVGSAGMAFLNHFDTLSAPWYAVLSATARDLNKIPGNRYRVMLVGNLFVYEGTEAVSTWDGTRYGRADLSAQIAGALAP